MNRIITRTMCILLALVLMSSSAVSFTYAEYARGAAMEDNARSTSWGVNLDLSGSAFATKYVTNEDYNGIDVSVKSSTADKILAPGTTGTFSGIDCSGSPEVSVQIEIDADLQLTNWVVNGNYCCPLVITINGEEYNGMEYPSSAAFEAAIENAIEQAAGVYPPNTNLAEIDGLNGDYHWYWAFDRTDYSSLGFDPNASGLTAEQVAQVDALRAPFDAQDSALMGKAMIALSINCSVYQVGKEPDVIDELEDDDDLEIEDGGPIIWF